jgi:lipopolysaccharide cholinephosphotransferase
MIKKEELKIFSDEELSIRNVGLSLIHEGMNELNIDFFLMMGVLLGAIREKDFIKWDWDVELGFITESIIDRVGEIKNKFESKEFEVELVDQSYEGFKINLFYSSNKYTLWGLHYNKDYLQRKSYKFPREYFLEFDYINFRGLKYKIPNNTEKLLEYIYGDWETPIRTNVKKEYLKSQIFIKENIINRVYRKIMKWPPSQG